MEIDLPKVTGHPFLSFSRIPWFSTPFSMDGTSVLPDSESQRLPHPLLPHFLSLLMSSGAWPSTGSLLPPLFCFVFIFISYFLFRPFLSLGKTPREGTTQSGVWSSGLSAYQLWLLTSSCSEPCKMGIKYLPSWSGCED